MKVIDHIKNASGKPLFSIEILPPLKGENIRLLFDNLDPLMEFKPPFIDVTYHREEYVYKKKDNGLLEKRSTRKRPGTVGICAAIQNHYKVDTVPHIICGGFTREETENALIDLNFLNVNNVLVLRGDAAKFEDKFNPHPEGHAYALDLAKQVNDMNHGTYLDPNISNGLKTDFCIGIAGYPEKHFESPSLATDLAYTKAKIDAGGQYIVTQMFFDNKYYIKYVEECRKMGINVPIVPGLKPITKKAQLTAIPRVFFINLPDELLREIQKAETDEAVKEVGIEWCIAQSKELKAAGVPCLHYYTMGDSATIRRIIEAVY